MRHHAVGFEKQDGIVTIDINAPLDDEETCAQAASDLAAFCSDVAWDEQVRVVILTYSGNLTGTEATEADEYAWTEGLLIAEPVAKLKQPVIAAIMGDALGLGLELGLACDIRIGTKGAFFGVPGVRHGLMPSQGGTQRLPRLIGRARALEMVLTGEPVDAQEALRIGLINRVAAPAGLRPMAMEMAQEMALKSPLSLSYVKEALYGGMDLTLDQGMRMELDLYLLLFTTQDRSEGITAFNEKRKPKFEGA